MRTMESLVALLGHPVTSEAVQAVVATERLTASSDPEFGQGEDRRHYLSTTAAGYQLMHIGGRIKAVFLYLSPTDGFRPFCGPLLSGLAIGATRAEHDRRWANALVHARVKQALLGLARDPDDSVRGETIFSICEILKWIARQDSAVRDQLLRLFDSVRCLNEGVQ